MITISEAIATITIVNIDFHNIYGFTISQTERRVTEVIIIIERIKIPIAIFLIDEFIFVKNNIFVNQPMYSIIIS